MINNIKKLLCLFSKLTPKEQKQFKEAIISQLPNKKTFTLDKLIINKQSEGIICPYC